MNNPVSSILIVDDMKINIDMLAEILGDSYLIMPSTSGEGAIKMLERRKPDLVLLDVYMPGLNGFDVLEYIKGNEKLSNIPVIFITGEHDEYTEERGLAMGAVDYIKKPYNASVVCVKVRNHLELKAYRDNLELLVQNRTEQLAASHEAIIVGMSLMSESHDKVTGEHVMRIKEFTTILAQKLLELYPDLITAETARQTALYSPLHDVGKVSISDVILKKTGVLTPEEFEIMKSHTISGGNLLRQTERFLGNGKDDNNFKIAIDITECHHERYDGTGYPYKMQGEEIPVPARIVSVADVYDALRSSRPYKKAFTHEEAVKIILNGDGRTEPKHFDPRVLNVFKIVQDKFEKFYNEQKESE